MEPGVSQRDYYFPSLLQIFPSSKRGEGENSICLISRISVREEEKRGKKGEKEG